jgi:hypothetical protein
LSKALGIRNEFKHRVAVGWTNERKRTLLICAIFDEGVGRKRDGNSIVNQDCNGDVNAEAEHEKLEDGGAGRQEGLHTSAVGARRETRPDAIKQRLTPNPLGHYGDDIHVGLRVVDADSEGAERENDGKFVGRGGRRVGGGGKVRGEERLNGLLDRLLDKFEYAPALRVFCGMRLFAVVLLNLAAKPIIEGALLLQFQLCGGRGVDDRKARGRQPVWSLRAAFAFGHSVNDAFGKGDVRVVI